MKATLGLLFASAALSTAQVIKNGNGTYTCALESGTYCVSASLESSMIIRCNNGVGYTSNCDERLADKAPLDTSYSPCWQASPRSGNAQCSKNGIIYPDGNNTTPYPVPNYQKISASISSAATATTAPSKFAYVANFTTSTTTSTSTNTHTTTVYISGVPLASYANSSSPYYATSDGDLANAAAATTAASVPYLPYFPIPVIPTYTQYTTDIVYSYTTVCPAGVTITDSAGSEAVLPTPSTITLTTTSRSTITATAIVSLPSPVFAFDVSSTTTSSEFAPVETAIAAAPYAWSNGTWSNVTTFAVVGTTAPVPVVSASATAHGPSKNQTMVVYTGTAGKISISFAAALVGLMALI
jgi:hypothetical protein